MLQTYAYSSRRLCTLSGIKLPPSPAVEKYLSPNDTDLPPLSQCSQLELRRKGTLPAIVSD
jgi:hypothetical protein